MVHRGSHNLDKPASPASAPTFIAPLCSHAARGNPAAGNPAHNNSAAGDLVASNRIWNVPNALTMTRLVLAGGVGVLIEWGWFFPALVAFIIAASTDFLDGWWARRFNQITKLGRVLDPFVDKIIVTAALVALVAQPNSQIAPWMVTIILGREFLVTSLRAMIEGQGGDFSARWLGKWKMLVQCAAVGASLWLLQDWQVWLQWTTLILAYLAVLITVISGLDYIVQAARSIRAASH